MNSKNYQTELDEILRQQDPNSPPKKLLIHSCCGPCSTYVLEYLSEFFEIGVLYYNPNIDPPGEFEFREKEQERLIGQMKTKHPVHMIHAIYDHQDFLDQINGWEGEREGGERCRICYRMRLLEAAKWAAKEGYDYFTTTLSISPHKNAEVLHEIACEVAKQVGIPNLPSNFKKKRGFLRSVELTEAYDMYRQDYCGCEFSKRDS